MEKLHIQQKTETQHCGLGTTVLRKDLSLITGSNALLVDERSPLWRSACEKRAALQLWGAQPLGDTCLEAALVQAEVASPNPPTGVLAAVEAYVEADKGLVLLWKFGEVFFPGGKHINISSCDMCQNLLPTGASRITCINFGLHCVVSILVRKKSHKWLHICVCKSSPITDLKLCPTVYPYIWCRASNQQ